MTAETREPTLLSLGEVEAGQDLLAAYAVMQNVREGRARNGSRYVDLELSDSTRTVPAKIWEDDEPAQNVALEMAAESAQGAVVKALFRAETYQGRVQLKIHRLRPAPEDEPGFDADLVYGPGHEHVRDLFCRTLVFDIETVPAVARRGLPPTVMESLAKAAQRMDCEEAKVMGLSPFFGKVVSLAIGDGELPMEEQTVTVLVVIPEGTDTSDFPSWIRPMSEADLLAAWWCLAARARTVVSYNGRGFDVPFLQTRSLIHGIPSRIDLISDRYRLRPHLDLYTILANRGGPTSLDVVCWALGIESPKEQMDGSMVAPAYERGEIEKIAHYNAHDVRATTAVYQRVRDSILRFRRDW